MKSSLSKIFLVLFLMILLFEFSFELKIPQEVIRKETNQTLASLSNKSLSNDNSTHKADAVPGIAYESVEIVNQLTPAGKAALELAKDNDYLTLVAPGYESPTFITEIIKQTPTNVKTPSHDPVYKYSRPDSNVWQNVEYHRYGNNLLETYQYLTPAEFQVNDFGRISAKAPRDSEIRVISSVPQIQAINFLDLEDKLTSDDEQEPDESFEGEDTVFNHIL